MEKELLTGKPVLQTTYSNPALKNGDAVYVRVVSDQGDGTYTVSFAGNRCTVTSLTPLKSGESFKALISVENSYITLRPLLEHTGLTEPNRTIPSFLSRIRMIDDDISVRIIQFFQQHYLKIDLPLAQKARNTALKFKGNEKDAAEAALFLSDKGIDITEDLAGLVMRSVRARGELNEKDTAILSYINHKKGSHKHWIILPFHTDPEQPISGTVKILCDTELKKAEKLIIECNTAVTKFIFMLQLYNYSNKQFKKVLEYTMQPPLNDADTHVFSNQLLALLGSEGITEVRCNRKLSEDGLFCQNGDLSYYQGSL